MQQVANNGTTAANNTVNSIETMNDTNRKLIGDYETSVTDKENALIHSFSNLIENNLTAPQQTPPTNNIHHSDSNSLHNNVKTNGKLVDFSLTDDHQNDIVKGPISNGNGHALINNLDNKM